MTYQIKENAKNVWIRDNENTQDLSPLTDANSVYFNSGRTLEQELGKGVMESNIVTVNSSMEKVIDEAYDGVYESLVFKGKTKWIDNDTQEILDDFVNGRNLSLIDCKMPILRNTGKNLFDGEWEAGQYDISGNKIDNYLDVDIRSKNYISVKPNKTYVLSNNGVLRATHIREYNINHEVVATHNAVNKFTTTPNTYYITGYGAKENREKFQIEESSTATTYEDHKTNILRTSEEIVLREVSGVQDTYNPLTGEYTKRIGEKVLCGETAEDWRDFRNTFIEKTETIDVYLINPEQKGNSNLLCDKMRTTSKGTYMNDEEGISCSGGSGLNIWVSIFKNKLSTPNKEGFKQWLQSNPITVQYELAEPVTTIVKPSTMTPFAYQNGHVVVESGYEGQSLTPILEYTAITNRTGQVENVAKTIQRHEAQLTLLEKMLITNIIELDYNNTLMALNLKMDEVK